MSKNATTFFFNILPKFDNYLNKKTKKKNINAVKSENISEIIFIFIYPRITVIVFFFNLKIKCT